MMTVANILEQARELSVSERKELAKLLIDMMDVPIDSSRRLSELRGLGKDIWRGVETQQYIDRMRDEWDNRS